MIPSNGISSVPRRDDSSEIEQPRLLLEYLSLAGNPISNWSDLDSLVSWLPRLYDLNISFEPLASGASHISSKFFEKADHMAM